MKPRISRRDCADAYPLQLEPLFQYLDQRDGLAGDGSISVAGLGLQAQAMMQGNNPNVVCRASHAIDTLRRAERYSAGKPAETKFVQARSEVEAAVAACLPPVSLERLTIMACEICGEPEDHWVVDWEVQGMRLAVSFHHHDAPWNGDIAGVPEYGYRLIANAGIDIFFDADMQLIHARRFVSRSGGKDGAAVYQDLALDDPAVRVQLQSAITLLVHGGVRKVGQDLGRSAHDAVGTAPPHRRRRTIGE